MIKRSGNGWSYCEEAIFDLTLKGIEVVLQAKKIDACVVGSRWGLSRFIYNAPLNRRSCCVIDASLLEPTQEGHFVALSIFKGATEDTLAILNSDGRSFSEEEIRYRYFYNRNAVIYQDREVRHSGDGCVCFSFAIRDCEKLMQNPNLNLDASAFEGLSLTDEEKIEKKKEDFEICLKASL